MTETEQEEIKAQFEKLVGEFTKKIAGLQGQITELQDVVARKNQALEGFMTENEALKDELGGRAARTIGKPGGTPQRLPVRLPRREDVAAKIQRWKLEAR